MSHSPLLNLPGPSAELLDDITGELARARAFVADYDPDLVVIFSAPPRPASATTAPSPGR